MATLRMFRIVLSDVLTCHYSLPIYNNKDEPYQLCIAKKVGSSYTVIFQTKRESKSHFE
jgi:hypothetical protein